MKRQIYSHNTQPLEDSIDESDDYTDSDLNAPKQSPMRRKEKFRIRTFQAERKHKERKRGYRNKIQYDYGFWEDWKLNDSDRKYLSKFSLDPDIEYGSEDIYGIDFSFYVSDDDDLDPIFSEDLDPEDPNIEDDFFFE